MEGVDQLKNKYTDSVWFKGILVKEIPTIGYDGLK